MWCFFTVGFGLFAFEYQQRWNKRHDHYSNIIKSLGYIETLSFEIIQNNFIDETTHRPSTSGKVVYMLKERIRNLSAEIEMSAIFIDKETIERLTSFYAKSIEEISDLQENLAIVSGVNEGITEQVHETFMSITKDARKEIQKTSLEASNHLILTRRFKRLALKTEAWIYNLFNKKP